MLQTNRKSIGSIIGNHYFLLIQSIYLSPSIAQIGRNTTAYILHGDGDYRHPNRFLDTPRSIGRYWALRPWCSRGRRPINLLPARNSTPIYPFGLLHASELFLVVAMVHIVFRGLFLPRIVVATRFEVRKRRSHTRCTYGFNKGNFRLVLEAEPLLPWTQRKLEAIGSPRNSPIGKGCFPQYPVPIVPPGTRQILQPHRDRVSRFKGILNLAVHTGVYQEGVVHV